MLQHLRMSLEQIVLKENRWSELFVSVINAEVTAAETTAEAATTTTSTGGSP